MDRLSAEKRLCLCYLTVIIAGGITSVSTGIAWGHWYKTLDQCIDRNCSCILYAKSTPNLYLGGEQAPCIWTVFGPLLYVFFTIGLTCFHGYRVLFTTKSPKARSTRAILARTEEETVRIQTITQEMTTPLPSTYWITMAVFTIICTIYALVHFGIYLDGSYTSCNEYRKTLEKLLSVHGSALPVIYNRLHCQGVFDFMDYMQLDTGNAYRNGIINTGLALIFGVVGSAFAWIAFCFTAILNFKLYQLNNEE